MTNYDLIMERIKPITGIKNASQLSKIIGVPQPTVNRKKNKGQFEIEWAYKLAGKYNLLTEWIMTGKGPKSLSSIDEEKGPVNGELVEDPEEDERQGQWVECYWQHKKIKTVQIHEGEIYIVDPINPQRKKYKGERVKLIHYDMLDGCEVLRLDSEWHMKRRQYIKMDICDLKLECKRGK